MRQKATGNRSVNRVKTLCVRQRPHPLYQPLNRVLQTKLTINLALSVSERKLVSPFTSRRSSLTYAGYPFLGRALTSQEVDNNNCEILSTDDGPSALYRSMTRHPAKYDEIIEVEDDEEDDLSESSDVQFLPVRSAIKPAPIRRKSSVKFYPPRNSPVVEPFHEMETFRYGSLTLRRGKTVELQDGDFLRIKVVVGNLQDHQAIMIRGQRLQRCSSMNGMLERKLNELCVFHEIDLDDPRDILEQSVVEVSVKDIKKLRNIRWTNRQFPKGQKLQDFRIPKSR